MPGDTHDAAQHQAAGLILRRRRGRLRAGPAAVPARGGGLAAASGRVAGAGSRRGYREVTRQLRDRGLDVIAVEPSEGMREQLARAVPGVPVHAGSAEEIPLADHSVDAVLVAQAWHWVDLSRAVPEVARVSSRAAGSAWCGYPGRAGGLGGRAQPDPDNSGPGSHDREDRGLIGPPFGPVERCDVEWTTGSAGTS